MFGHYVSIKLVKHATHTGTASQTSIRGQDSRGTNMISDRRASVSSRPSSSTQSEESQKPPAQGMYVHWPSAPAVSTPFP